MANIPIRNIPLEGTPTGSAYLVFDDGQMKKGKVESLADAVRPVASQGEAVAGVESTKVMPSLRVKESIASEVGVTLASKAQGDLANTALQPAAVGVSIQAYDADLQAIAALAPADDSFIQRKSGAWAARSLAQVKGDLAIPAPSSESDAVTGSENTKFATSLRVTQRIRAISGEVNVIDFVDLPTDIDGGPDTSAGINAALAYALANNLNLVIPGAIWPVDGPINTPSGIIRIRGEQGRAQPTILYKRYAEPDPLKGMISLGTHGGELLDLQFAAKDGASGGSAISAILPTPAANIGVLRLRNLYSSCRDGTNYAMVISGAENVAPGGPGYRSVFADSLEMFGAKIGVIALIDVHHFFGTNILLATTGGSVLSGFVLDIQGSDTLTRYNDDIHIHSGLIAGNVQAGYLNRSSILAPVAGSLSYGAHCNYVNWLSVTGGVTGTAANSFVLRDNAILERGGDHVNGWQRHGNGRLEQWGVTGMSGAGTGSVTFTVPFGVPPQHVSANVRAAMTNPLTYLPIATVVDATATVLTLASHGIATPGGSSFPISAVVHWRAIGL